MSKFIKHMHKILGYALSALMFLMFVNVLWQVFSRYILNSPSSFTDELARYFMIWLGVLGGAYVAGIKSHLAIDLFKQKLKINSRVKLDKILSFIILLFALMAMVVGGSRLVYITYFMEQTSAALQIPLAYVYSVIPLAGVIIVLYKINEIIYPDSLKEVHYD